MIYKKRDIFNISSENSSKQPSPLKGIKKDNNKGFFLKTLSEKELSRNSLPDSLYLNYSYIKTSEKKEIFEIEQKINKEIDIFEEKNIAKYGKSYENKLISKQEINDKKEKQNLYLTNKKNNKKEYNSIDIIINDTFWDLLVNIYRTEGIEIGFQTERRKYSENKYNFNVSLNLDKNKYMMEEQISCICLKSKCLNNYCSCHKSGQICNNNCRCIGCENNNNI